MSSLDSSSDLLDLRSTSSSAGLRGASDRDGGLTAEKGKQYKHNKDDDNNNDDDVL